jgi:hypothetical protein
MGKIIDRRARADQLELDAVGELGVDVVQAGRVGPAGLHSARSQRGEVGSGAVEVTHHDGDVVETLDLGRRGQAQQEE